VQLLVDDARRPQQLLTFRRWPAASVDTMMLIKAFNSPLRNDFQPIGEMLEKAVPHRGHAAGWQARQKALPQEQQGA
jgi:hypothetical protein